MFVALPMSATILLLVYDTIWFYLIFTFRQVRLFVNYIDPQFERITSIGPGIKGC